MPTAAWGCQDARTAMGESWALEKDGGKWAESSSFGRRGKRLTPKAEEKAVVGVAGVRSLQIFIRQAGFSPATGFHYHVWPCPEPSFDNSVIPFE